MSPLVQSYFDSATATISYIVYDQIGGRCALIDSVLDYDPVSGKMTTRSADQLIAFVQKNRLQVDWILETHVHADHLTAAAYLKSQLGGAIGISRHIKAVQAEIKKDFNWGAEFQTDGSQFDHLFDDQEHFQIGNLSAIALEVPGHTPSCLAYLIGDAIFVGDALFMPDVGTGRCDFPGGDAQALYQSIQKILRLPATTRLFVCHDYPPAQRSPRWETTVAQQRTGNIHVYDGVTQEGFVAMRTARDKTLSPPALIKPALQANVRGGVLPNKI